MPWTKIYSERKAFDEAARESTEPLRGLTYREALREAHAELLKSDERVILLGEGIDDPGGVFGSTKGLAEEFGTERVMDSPLAENGITGVAIGAALAGLRPILIHMRMDFLPLSMDQIINHAAKWHYMFGGKINVPLVIRGIVGRGWGSAAQHSQSLHALFTHVPGLKVVAPATPFDAKALLLAASKDGNPIIFLEHRHLYEHVGHVPEDNCVAKLGEAQVRREGTDITIVAVSHMVYTAIAAAEGLADEGISAEVIDIRSLRPLDKDGLINSSIKKTGALLVADIGWSFGGVASEISARIMEDKEAFSSLKAPLARINPADVPTPASPVLEEAYYPGASDIIKAAREIVESKK